MKAIRKIIWLWVLLSSAALAQFTTVTGTVTDPNGLPYALGTISSLIISSGTPIFTSNSQPYFQPTQATGLDSAGKFTVRLADNSLLSPGGSTWTFTVCSAVGTVAPSFGKGPICFVVSGVTISGSSQDIGATLSAAAPALTANFGSSSSVSGSGTNGTFAVWTGANSLGNGPLTFTSNLISLPATGTWQNYHGLTSVGNGMAQVVGLRSGSSFTGNMAPQNIIASVPASAHQYFRINCYLVVSTAATSSSTLPQCQASWTDFTTGVVETATFAATNTANTVGAFTQGTIFINPQPGTAVTVSTTGYTSVGGTAMIYINGFDLESL